MLLPFCVLDAGDAAELWALKGIYTSRGGNAPDTECEDDPILGSGGKKALWNVASVCVVGCQQLQSPSHHSIMMQIQDTEEEGYYYREDATLMDVVEVDG